MLSQKSLALILSDEGLDQPSKWPGGASGVTIGIGYDLGQCTHDQFQADWGTILPKVIMDRLSECIGVKGEDAKEAAEHYKDITIKRSDAEKVFTFRSVPQEEKLTLRAFPGADKLPEDAFGALVSLVYNRGISMLGDSRAEMRAIRDAVANSDLQGIATQLRSMKRLWVGKGLDGLISRREDEAKLVESCIK